MNKTLIIAEAGVNHNGDMEIAKKLIDAAAEAGVDYVKFQTFKTENLVSASAKKAEYQIANAPENEKNTQFDMLKKLELSEADHHFLIDYCRKKNIRFLSTAFDLGSIDLLVKLGIDLFKIPSGEITNLPFLRKVGKLGKKVILSTGMSDIQEVTDAVNVLLSIGTKKENLTVLHCNSEYPTPMQDVNLSAMHTLSENLGVPIGYSDHTKGIEVPIAAVAMGAVVIEKHFTLDRSMEGPDHKASLEPGELKDMVTAIRNIEMALGSGEKTASPSESKNKSVARKSIHIANDLKKGHSITESDLVMKRPGNGISPMKMDEVIGKKINRDLNTDAILSWEDLS